MPPKRSTAAATSATGGAAVNSAMRRTMMKKLDPEATKAQEERVRREKEREAQEQRDLQEWESLNRKTWRGLGLTDPVKTVEVSFVLYSPGFPFRRAEVKAIILRTSGFYFQPSSK